MLATSRADEAAIRKDPKIDPPGTPPKNWSTMNSGRLDTRRARMKKSRPKRLPRTIWSEFSGVESRISQVRGFASCAMAPAMNTGVSRHTSRTWMMLTNAKIIAPVVASDRSDVVEEVKFTRSIRSIRRIRAPRNPPRITSWRIRNEPPVTTRTQIGLVGSSRRNQLRMAGIVNSSFPRGSRLHAPTFHRVESPPASEKGIGPRFLHDPPC